MQSRDARHLRETVSPCEGDHDLDKEYDFGAQTGDLVCIRCGQCFTREEADRLKERGRTEGA
jgi:hypothetical protein